MAYEINEDPEILEDLLCPVCLDLPNGEIYICRNGHNICCICCEVTSACPQCRVSFTEGKTRNRAVESLIGSMQCPCPYRQVGCMKILRRRHLEEHKLACIYNGKCVQFCKLLDYKCDFWTTTLNINAAVKHFLESHAFLLVRATKANFAIEEILAKTKPLADREYVEDFMWTPVILEYQSGNNEGASKRIMIVCRYHGEDRSISWIPVFLGEPTENMECLDVSFKITSGSPQKIPHLTWRQSIFSVLHETVISNQLVPFRVPLHVLQTLYIHNDNNKGLQIGIELMTTEDDYVVEDPIPGPEITISVFPIRKKSSRVSSTESGETENNQSHDAATNSTTNPSEGLSIIFTVLMVAFLVRWFLG